MPPLSVDLSRFRKAGFDRGATRLKECLWALVRFGFFLTPCPLPSAFRVFWLRLFGARIGAGVVIRSRVDIWFPWRLELGDHVWLGEEVFILNLAPVTIASHVCISQRAFLCTGNHDYSSDTFDLITESICVEQGSWVGACCFIGPGVTVGSHAVLAAGGVATKDLKPWGIYQGNPAVWVRERARSLHRRGGKLAEKDRAGVRGEGVGGSNAEFWRAQRRTRKGPSRPPEDSDQV